MTAVGLLLVFVIFSKPLGNAIAEAIAEVLPIIGNAIKLGWWVAIAILTVWLIAKVVTLVTAGKSH